jgi:hypothetical protein
MEKIRWQKPKLIILSRIAKGEYVLDGGCKTLKLTGPSNDQNRCSVAWCMADCAGQWGGS